MAQRITLRRPEQWTRVSSGRPIGATIILGKPPALMELNVNESAYAGRDRHS